MYKTNWSLQTIQYRLLRRKKGDDVIENMQLVSCWKFSSFTLHHYQKTLFCDDVMTNFASVLRFDHMSKTWFKRKVKVVTICIV